MLPIWSSVLEMIQQFDHALLVIYIPFSYLLQYCYFIHGCLCVMLCTLLYLQCHICLLQNRNKISNKSSTIRANHKCLLNCKSKKVYKNHTQLQFFKPSCKMTTFLETDTHKKFIIYIFRKTCGKTLMINTLPSNIFGDLIEKIK